MERKKRRRRASVLPSKKSVTPQPKTIANALAAAIRAELPHLRKPPENANKKIWELTPEESIQLSLEDRFTESNEPSSREIEFDSSGDILIDVSSDSTNDEISDKKNNFYVCILDNLASKASCMHTEHAFCEDSIKDNLEFLLNYLNAEKNKAITDIFLEIQDMKPLFEKRLINKIAKKIKVFSTKVLEDACSAEVSNLWKVCASCNLEKSNKPIAEFLKDNPLFGSLFLKALEEKGGIRTGVLISTIYPVLEESNTVSIKYGQNELAIARASKLPKRMAIATFVKEWYIKNHGAAFKINKNLQGTHMKLTKKLLEAQRKTLAGEGTRSQRFVKRTAQAYKMASNLYKDLDSDENYSDSESDTETQEKHRGENFYDVISYTQDASHYLKSIKRLLQDKNYHNLAGESKVLENYLSLSTTIQLDANAWKAVRTELKGWLSNNSNKLTVKSFDKYLKALIEKKSKIRSSSDYSILKDDYSTLKKKCSMLEDQLYQEKKALKKAKKEIKRLENQLSVYQRPSNKKLSFFCGASNSGNTSNSSNRMSKRKRKRSKSSDSKEPPKKKRKY